jgi:hypothetical protein
VLSADRRKASRTASLTRVRPQSLATSSYVATAHHPCLILLDSLEALVG